jgi:hypothetical protein
MGLYTGRAMLSHLRHNWLAPLMVALAFTVIATLIWGSFDPGRAVTVFTGLFIVNSILGLVIHLVLDRKSRSTE